MPWSLTVAALIEREGRFLCVEEAEGPGGGLVLNQPAGHVEDGESILDAVVREVREETGLAFAPEALLGLYQLCVPDGRQFLRVCFTGFVAEGEARPQDPDIHACHWLGFDEIAARPLRSGLVLRCLEDWRGGRRLPLSAVSALLRED